MDKAIVLVTGANTGLGFQIIRALCDSDKQYEILVGGRSLVKAQQAAKAAIDQFPSTQSRTWPIQVDIEDDESIKGAFQEVESKFGRLDALVNNAGGQFDPQYYSGQLTMRQMWNHSWNVNTVGTQVMTSTFVPLLLKSKQPRLLFITSGTSTLTGSENTALRFNMPLPAGWPKKDLNPVANVPAYRSSKTGMNMMMREWHRALENDNVKVLTISPGFLATGLGGRGAEGNKSAGGQDPRLGGEFVRLVVEGGRDGDAGKVIMRDGVVQPW